jgi:hypothetical protein
MEVPRQVVEHVVEDDDVPVPESPRGGIELAGEGRKPAT